MFSPDDLREEAIVLHVDADELCFDARWHTSLFPADEWPVIKRRLRERQQALTLRADRLRDALSEVPASEGQEPKVAWYLRWRARRVERTEPISAPWLQDLYRRTRILLSTAHEFIDPNGMGTRH